MFWRAAIYFVIGCSGLRWPQAVATAAALAAVIAVVLSYLIGSVRAEIGLPSNILAAVALEIGVAVIAALVGYWIRSRARAPNK